MKNPGKNEFCPDENMFGGDWRARTADLLRVKQAL